MITFILHFSCPNSARWRCEHVLAARSAWADPATARAAIGPLTGRSADADEPPGGADARHATDGPRHAPDGSGNSTDGAGHAPDGPRYAADGHERAANGLAANGLRPHSDVPGHAADAEH